MCTGVSETLLKLRVRGVHGQSMKVKDVVMVLHDKLVAAQLSLAEARDKHKACALGKVAGTLLHILYCTPYLAPTPVQHSLLLHTVRCSGTPYFTLVHHTLLDT